MFCDGCGTALQVGQQFCAKCGKPVLGPAVAGYPQRSRVREHVRMLGILWLAFACLELVGGFVLYVVANTIFGVSSPGGPPAEMRPFLHTLLSFISVFLVIKAAAGLAAGWGLLQRDPWARILALVLAFVALFHVPFGTALGVYTLWVLLPAQSDVDYEEHVRTAAA